MRMKKQQIDAATAAYHELLRVIPQKQIDAELRTAMHRAKVWYRLNGQKFRLPK